jgi:hypothetical protein
MAEKFTESIEFVHSNYWLCQRGVYSESSVLAGQDFRRLMRAYDSLEEAKAANPGVPVPEEAYAPEPVVIPLTAPAWFDEANAGERWDEDY